MALKIRRSSSPHKIKMKRVGLLLLALCISCTPIMSILRGYICTLSLRRTRTLLTRLFASSKSKSQGKTLVIVESPTKAKTIGTFLQSNAKYQHYIIDSCAGHIREISSEIKDGRVIDANLNLKISDLGIDVFRNFEPEYRVMPQKREVIQRLKDHCKDASEILLATDEDREGEAISAHLVDVLKPSIPYKRVVFHEITKSAIENAFEQPRDIDTNLVHAQEARSILDKLAGYTLSPLLWRFITYGLSAGRVQSCGLKLIAEKEKQRWEFKSSNYHTIDAMLKSNKLSNPLVARLHTISALRVATDRDFDGLTGAIKLALQDKVAVLDTERSRAILEELSAKAAWEVTNKQSKVIMKSPPLPFITSSLQQDSSRQLGYSPGRTMQLAQGLYERGYITYMRTDSPTLSDNAKAAATKLIVDMYGKEYLANEGDKKKSSSAKPKNAQEAHEAIRPSESNGIFRHPDVLRGELAGDEWKVYDLIFRRTVASFMKPSESLSVTLTVSAGEIGNPNASSTKAKKGEGMGEAFFRCSSTTVTSPGYLKVWDSERSRTYRENELTRLDVGDKLSLVRSEEVWRQDAAVVEEDDLGDPSEPASVSEDAVDDSSLKLVFPGLRSVGRATKAPGRYTESSFIHALETIGVGRPSTYSYILSILREREYIIVDKQSLIPTVKGLLVSQFLTEHFQHFISEEFTAKMESNLDAIAKGDIEKSTFLSQFYFGLDVPPSSPTELSKIKKEDAKGLLQTASHLIDLQKVWKDESNEADRKEYKSLTIPQLADLGKVRVSRNGLLFTANNSVVPDGDTDQERMWKLPLEIELDIRELTRERVLEILKTAPNLQGNLLGMLPETKENVFLKYGRYGKYLELIPEGVDTAAKKVPSRTFKLPYSWYNMTALDSHVSMEDIGALILLPKTLGTSELQGHGIYEASVDVKNNDLAIIFKQVDGDESKRQVFMLPFPRPSFLPGSSDDFSLSKFSAENAVQLLKTHLDNPLGSNDSPAQEKLVKLTDCREIGTWNYDADKQNADEKATISIRYGRFGYYLHASRVNIVAGLGKRPVESVTLEMAVEMLEKKKARMSKAALAASKTVKKSAPKSKSKVNASKPEKKSTVRTASLKPRAKATKAVGEKVVMSLDDAVAQPKVSTRTKAKIAEDDSATSVATSAVKSKVAAAKTKKETIASKAKSSKSTPNSAVLPDHREDSSEEENKPKAAKAKAVGLK